MLLGDWRKQNSPHHCRAGLSFPNSGALLTNYSFIPFIPVQPKHCCSIKSPGEKLCKFFGCCQVLIVATVWAGSVCHITRVMVLRNQRELGKYPSIVIVEQLCYSHVLFQKGSHTHLPPNSDSFCWTSRAQTALVSQHWEEIKTSLLSSKTPQVQRHHHSVGPLGSHTQALILLSLQTHTPNRPLLPCWLPMHLLTINIWVFYLGWFFTSSFL